jgi:hypothetical protein
MNPVSTVVAGPGELVAASGGIAVGGFAWVVDGQATYGTVGSTVNSVGVPAGFVANEQQALITVWLGADTLIVPEGLPVTLYDRGDFWVRSTFNDASVGQKVFANVFTGQINVGATGAALVDPAGVTGTITASFATNVMTVTVTAVYIAPGMHVTGTGVPPNTYIEAQLGGSAGSTGTYSLSTYPGTVGSAATVVVTSPEGVGGCTASSVSANSGSTSMTINTITNGAVAAGMVVKGTGITAGTHIAALVGSTGGTGTITLSAVTTDTISAAAVTFSPWIETPFYVKSAGNVHDLIKIGVLN